MPTSLGIFHAFLVHGLSEGGDYSAVELGSSAIELELCKPVFPYREITLGSVSKRICPLFALKGK